MSSLGSLINLLCGLYRSSAHVLLCLQTAHSFSRPSDVLISDPVNSVFFLGGGFLGVFFLSAFVSKPYITSGLTTIV